MNWIAERFPSLVDEFLESWVCWRETCADVRCAYERWEESEPLERELRFVSYGAALDREEHAARIHSDWTERLRVSGAAKIAAPGGRSA